ncbi:uncharacterized protein [Anabrus simplex]|uniref:uncharacterized protein n=1 Tax=Anabrus simplex TaxID=316456 RepID=UPI0035A28887
MSQCSYVQLFLLGLLCTGALSAPTATCTEPRAQSNIDINQLYGDWFLGKSSKEGYWNETQCYRMSVNKVDETTLEASIIYNGIKHAQTFTIVNTENAGTWQIPDSNRTLQVIYLSEDRTTMALCGCEAHHAEPASILLSKQLPVSLEKTEEFRLALELAGMSGDHQFVWESQATCSSA